MWSGLGTSLLGSLVSTGGSLLGSYLNAEYAEDAAETAYERQLELLGIQQKYATDMSNTSYQRSVKDLKKAGLNPILAATGGLGSSTPVVSASSVSPASGVDYGDLGLGKAGDLIGKSSAQGLASSQAKQIEANSKSQRGLNDANASTAKAQAELLRKQAEKVEEEKNLVRAQTKEINHTKIERLPGRALEVVENWLKDHMYNSAKSSQNNRVKGKVIVTHMDGTPVNN